MNNGRKGGHFEFDQVKFFQDASSSEISHFVYSKIHPLLKPYNLFDINGVAILSGFHDILQYQACRGEKWLIGGHF